MFCLTQSRNMSHTAKNYIFCRLSTIKCPCDLVQLFKHNFDDKSPCPADSIPISLLEIQLSVGPPLIKHGKRTSPVDPQFLDDVPIQTFSQGEFTSISGISDCHVWLREGHPPRCLAVPRHGAEARLKAGAAWNPSRSPAGRQGARHQDLNINGKRHQK